MSYKCENCKGTVPNCMPQIKIIVEKRDKTYPNGSIGWETVKEKVLCSSCNKDKEVKKS